MTEIRRIKKLKKLQYQCEEKIQFFRQKRNYNKQMKKKIQMNKIKQKEDYNLNIGIITKAIIII